MRGKGHPLAMVVARTEISNGKTQAPNKSKIPNQQSRAPVCFGVLRFEFV
jgi:hypothetical protein